MKIKKYIFTETGENRSPKDGEYFVNICGNVQRAVGNGLGERTILSLEVVEENWKPRLKDIIYFIKYNTVTGFVVTSYTAYEEDDIYKTVISTGNAFPSKELAEAKLNEILKLLKS